MRHVLRALEVLNLLPKRLEFLFGKLEHMMATLESVPESRAFSIGEISPLRSVCGGSMQNRRRLAVAFAVFGLLASAALALFTELSHFQPWNSAWAALIPFAWPANFLLGRVLFDANATLLNLGAPDNLEHNDLFRDWHTVGKAPLAVTR